MHYLDVDQLEYLMRSAVHAITLYSRLHCTYCFEKILCTLDITHRKYGAVKKMENMVQFRLEIPI